MTSAPWVYQSDKFPSDSIVHKWAGRSRKSGRSETLRPVCGLLHNGSGVIKLLLFIMFELLVFNKFLRNSAEQALLNDMQKEDQWHHSRSHIISATKAWKALTWIAPEGWKNKQHANNPKGVEHELLFYPHPPDFHECPNRCVIPTKGESWKRSISSNHFFWQAIASNKYPHPIYLLKSHQII